VIEDATGEHAVLNKTTAEDVVVVVLTEEDLVQIDPNVGVTCLVEKES